LSLQKKFGKYKKGKVIMRSIFNLEISRKIFFNCFNSYFLGLDQFGVMFFKIELTYNNISKRDLTSRMSLFKSILRDVELSHCLYASLTPNKVSAIFGVRPLFIRSSSLIEFMIRSHLADHGAFLNCKLEYFSDIKQVVDYFKEIVLYPDLIFFDWRMFEIVSYPYGLENVISYIIDTDCYPFSKKKLFIEKTELANSVFDKGVPPAHQDSYDERTIIKIWALYCKVRCLVLNESRELVDLDGQVLGDYRVYLVDNFFDICIFLKDTHFGYNFLPLNIYDLYVQYIEKAKNILYFSPSVLFFVKESLSDAVSEKNRLEHNRIVKMKSK
jgi:hypothetical protein